MSTIPMKSEVETLSSGSASGDWLERENAVIMGVVLLILGVVVIAKGLAYF